MNIKKNRVVAESDYLTGMAIEKAVRRIVVSFSFKERVCVAHVLIKENVEGYNYIINLFDRQLDIKYPRSYTLIGKGHQFIPSKPMSDDNLELVNVIKEAIKLHPDNPYLFN